MRPRAEAELEALYRRYRADVYRYALSTSRDESEAEEVTQAAFLSAYRALVRGGRPRRPRAWLLAIAENVRRRRLRRPREAPLPESYEAPVPEPDVTTAELVAAIAALPEPQRRALVLRELGGRSYGEIAGELETTIGAVQMLLFRARRALRERLRRVGAVPAPFWLDGGAGSAGPALRAGAAALGAVTLALGAGGSPPPVVTDAEGRLVAPPASAVRTVTGQTQRARIEAPSRPVAAKPVRAPAREEPSPSPQQPLAPALAPASVTLPQAPAVTATPTAALPPPPVEVAPPEAPLELPALPELPQLPEAPALPELGGAQLPQPSPPSRSTTTESARPLLP